MTKEYDRILDFIKEDDFEIILCWIDKNTYGEIHYEPEQKILINIYLLVFDTFIHEYMHEKYPELKGLKGEEKINDKTRKFVSRMKVSEIKKLAKYLMAEYHKS